MKSIKTLEILALILLLGIPTLSEACPMCQGGSTETTVFAYQATTIFLALMPFAIGTAIYKWIKRNANASN